MTIITTKIIIIIITITIIITILYSLYFSRVIYTYKYITTSNIVFYLMALEVRVIQQKL